MQALWTCVVCLLVASCSPYQRKLDTAKQDGNMSLYDCLRICAPDDGACHGVCDEKHPTKWYQRYTTPLKELGKPWKELWESSTVFMHPYAVQSAYNDGNADLGDCYSECEPDALECLRGCDQQHASEEERARRLAMQRYLVKHGIAAIIDIENKRRHAKRPHARTGSSATSSPVPSTNSSASSTSGQPPKPPRPGGSSCGPQLRCETGQRCYMAAKDGCQGENCFNFGCR
jgi:hypothetical protein